MPIWKRSHSPNCQSKQGANMSTEALLQKSNLLDDVEVLFDDIVASEPSVDSCCCCCVSCCCSAATSSIENPSESSL